MNDQELLSRIVCDPDRMLGKPVVRGTRLTVEHLLNLQAHGASVDEILAEYEGLTADDLRACLLFASESLSNASFLPLNASQSNADAVSR